MDNNFSGNRPRVWLAWLVASLFLSYQYVIRVLPNVIMPYLEEHFHINASQFGQFSGSYYIAYTLMHIPLGIMLDLFGPRLIISSCILLVITGLIPLIYYDSWALTSLGRIMIGMASSAGILGTFKVIRMGFPGHKFPFILGISVTIGFLGASCGGNLVDYFAKIIGLGLVLKSLMVIGFLLSVLAFFTLPSYRIKNQSNTLTEIKELFSHAKWIVIAALGGLMVGPIEGFADGWATTFLKVAYSGLDSYLFTLLPSLILLGLAIGAPLIGYIGEKTGSYYRIIITSGIAMFCGFIIIFLRVESVPVLLMTFIMIGFFSSYQTLIIHKSCTLVPEKFIGLTTACANMIIMIFGYFFHSFIGEVVEWRSTSGYTFESLVSGISIIPICLLLASCGFIYILIKEGEK